MVYSGAPSEDFLIFEPALSITVAFGEGVGAAGRGMRSLGAGVLISRRLLLLKSLRSERPLQLDKRSGEGYMEVVNGRLKLFAYWIFAIPFPFTICGLLLPANIPSFKQTCVGVRGSFRLIGLNLQRIGSD